MWVKIAIFHNLDSGSELWSVTSGIPQSIVADCAREHLPKDKMVRMFEGYVGVYRESSGAIWIDTFCPVGDDPPGDPRTPVRLDHYDLTFILSWVDAMTGAPPQSQQGPQREAAMGYHGRKLRPLTRGDVMVIGEAPFVYCDPAGPDPGAAVLLDASAWWVPLTSPIREVRPQAMQPDTVRGREGGMAG